MKHLIERMQYQYLTANGIEFPNSLEGDLLKACYEVFTKEKSSKETSKRSNLFVYREEVKVSEGPRGEVMSRHSFWEVYLLQGTKITEYIKSFDTEQEAIYFCEGANK